MLHYTILYCIILYYTILHYTLLYYTILYSTMLCYTQPPNSIAGSTRPRLNTSTHGLNGGAYYFRLKKSQWRCCADLKTMWPQGFTSASGAQSLLAPLTQVRLRCRLKVLKALHHTHLIGLTPPQNPCSS